MNKLFIFVLGATIGSLVTWKIVDEKYKRLADEEIESVREYYKNKEKEEKIEEECDISNTFEDYKTIKAVEEYSDKIVDLGYSIQKINESDTTITEQHDVHEVYISPVEEHIAPYVISPEEFGEIDCYDTKSWTYYADFVLTDEVGEIVFEPEEIIGDALEHFGEYEEDAVHVRNENLECEYEILKYEKTFSEINREDS